MKLRSRQTLTYTITGLTLIVLACIDIHIGAIKLSTAEIIHAITGHSGEAVQAIILKLRLPRIITAILAGAGLAISGAQMQTVFRNPLADPHILGVSAGAGTGVAIATITLGTGLVTSIAASIGAICICLIIIWISTKMRRASELLIAGVMLGFIMSAITSVIEYQANETSLKIYWNWAAGSFSGNSWPEIWTMFIAIVIGLLVSILQNKGLSLLLFGDDYATSAGANVRKIRFMSMLSCSIITGAVTAFCGPIGFVGIVAPHIAKAISGQAAMKTILPLSLMTGATICVAGDILSQLWKTPIPVGSTIALIGIPIILLVMRKHS